MEVDITALLLVVLAVLASERGARGGVERSLTQWGTCHPAVVIEGEHSIHLSEAKLCSALGGARGCWLPSAGRIKETTMTKLGSRQRSHLARAFGDRVCFRKSERRLYGHDIAAVPGLIKPLIGDTTPEAVVQPETEEELVELVRWASQRRVPLTPRGKASSGYGGVLPIKKGIVVDFYRMNRVIRVDVDAQTATVQAGVVWEKLDRELKKHGLTLRLYPTSYPASTVGGWLAQGGAGIGSYESGWFSDNVVSARVVLGDGTVSDFSGTDLELVADAEGITGLISEVTVRVQPADDLELVAIGCPDAHDLQRLLQSLVDEKLPIWSLVFINPRMAELKNRAPLMEHHGHPMEERVLLPAAYITTLAFRARDRQAVAGRLPELIKACEAEILSDRIAQHEWDHRFKLMVVKRLGPSLVPAEIVVPLSSLGPVLTDIERKVHQPVVKEGVVIREGRGGEPEVVILGFIPSDQRTFRYNFVFSLVLTIMKIAEKHGGRPYATGLYFARKAKQVLGGTGPGDWRRPRGNATRKESSIRARCWAAGWWAEPSAWRTPSSPSSGRLGTASYLRSGSGPASPCMTSRLTWPGMPTAAPSVATASRSAISSTAGGGKAKAPVASGTGCESTWRAARSGISSWSTPSWSAPPVSCATCAARQPFPSSRHG